MTQTTAHPLQIIECLESDPDRLTINCPDGRVTFTQGDLEIANLGAVRRLLQLAKVRRLQNCIIEFNPKRMTLDLHFRNGRKGSHQVPLRNLTWDDITHEFLDALFCANQRLRSWE